jgi:hypothetical protein
MVPVLNLWNYDIQERRDATHHEKIAYRYKMSTWENALDKNLILKDIVTRKMGIATVTRA